MPGQDVSKPISVNLSAFQTSQAVPNSRILQNMADEDMVDADLSLWTGKSPLKPEVQLTVAEEDKDEEEEEAPVVVNMQHRNSLRSNSSSCSVDAFSSTNLATESFSGRQALDTDEDENIVDLDDSTFYIELPELDPRTLEEYEHLPGHDTAVTIISAQQMGRYYVKRGSGEKDLVSYDFFPLCLYLVMHFGRTLLTPSAGKQTDTYFIVVDHFSNQVLTPRSYNPEAIPAEDHVSADSYH